MTNGLSRRNLLSRAAALSALPAAGALFGANPVFAAAAAPKTSRTIADIAAMSPFDMARDSAVVQAAWQRINAAADKLQDAALRKTVKAILANPAPTIVGTDAAKLTAALQAKNYVAADTASVFPEAGNVQESPQPFWSAPGSGYASHHAYPGGLATHVALNVAAAEALYAEYQNVDGLKVSFDDAVGGEILHDLHKPWVFQWQTDGSCRRERKLAGTGEHHVLSIAESMKRGLPASFVVAQACAHDHPGTPASEKSVVAWLDCAAMIAGKDPVREGYLAADGLTLPLPRRIEGFVVHLADHDFVISSPACQWTVAALKRLAEKKYGVRDEKTFNALRNYVLANLTAMRLYGILSEKGEAAFEAEVARVVRA